MISQKKPFFFAFFILTLIFILLFQSCTLDRPKLLKKKIFISVYAELMIIEQLALDEPEKLELTASVFINHQTTKARFLATKEYYKQNPKYWSKIYKAVEEKIRESDKKQVMENERKKQ